jgi:hypothetical protein
MQCETDRKASAESPVTALPRTFDPMQLLRTYAYGVGIHGDGIQVLDATVASLCTPADVFTGIRK